MLGVAHVGMQTDSTLTTAIVSQTSMPGMACRSPSMKTPAVVALWRSTSLHTNNMVSNSGIVSGLFQSEPAMRRHAAKLCQAE